MSLLRVWQHYVVLCLGSTATLFIGSSIATCRYVRKIFCGFLVQSSGQLSLTGVICLCMGIFVQSCGYPSQTGMMCLHMGFLVQSSGHPSLNGMICLHMRCSVQSCGHPSLTGTMGYIGIGPKLWTNCSFKHVIFVYTGEVGPKFSLRCVHAHSTCVCNILVTYILHSHLRWRWTFCKNPQGQITQVVGDRSLYPSTNSNWTSYVDLLFMYMYRVWVGSCPGPPQINWFAYQLCVQSLWSGDKVSPCQNSFQDLADDRISL